MRRHVEARTLLQLSWLPWLVFLLQMNTPVHHSSPASVLPALV